MMKERSWRNKTKIIIFVKLIIKYTTRDKKKEAGKNFNKKKRKQDLSFLMMKIFF